jgi:SAM-dependent methyltransferase
MQVSAVTSGESTIRVNLGCGETVPEGWINVDYSIGARLVRVPVLKVILRWLGLFNADWSDRVLIHDLRTTLPWTDNSIDAVYSSHTLEHMTLEDGSSLLRECYRSLKSGGAIRIVVPDLEDMVQAYAAGNLTSAEFIDALGMGFEQKGDTAVKKFLAPYFRFPHRCMYDHKSLAALLEAVGFVAEARGAFESSIPGIREVERESRTQGAVIVEGRKP